MSRYCPHCYRPASESTAHCDGADKHLRPAGGWPALPKELYGWTLDSLAGKGGFGTVYRATPPAYHRSGPPKVVKVAGRVAGLTVEELHRIYNQELLANMQIRQELADLRSQGHLPPIVDGYWRITPEDAPMPVVAMNWVGDPTLKQKLTQGPLPERELLRLGVGVCRALRLLAHYRLVHCDIKPENIFVSDQGTVQVADLGSCVDLKDPGPAPDLSVPVRRAPLPALLTVAYASPEQLRGDALDCKSDIYSLAVVLWEGLTGQLPFPMPPEAAKWSIDRRAAEQLKLRATVPSKPTGMSPELYEILRAALSEGPAGRKDADAFSEQLQGLLTRAGSRLAELRRRLAALEQEHEAESRRLAEFRHALESIGSSERLTELEQGLGGLERELARPDRAAEKAMVDDAYQKGLRDGSKRNIGGGEPRPASTALHTLTLVGLGFGLGSVFWVSIYALPRLIAERVVDGSPKTTAEPSTIPPPRTVIVPISSLDSVRVAAGPIPADPLLKTSAGSSPRDVFVSTTEVTNRLYASLVETHSPCSNGATPAAEAGLPAECLSAWEAMRFAVLVSEKDKLEVPYIFTFRGQPLDMKDWKQVQEAGYSELSVSWDTKKSGWRLPEGLEWEAAARGGKEEIFAGTSTLRELSKYANLPGWTGACQKLSLGIVPSLGGFYGLECTDDTFPGIAPPQQFSPNAIGLYDMTGNVAEWTWPDGVLSLSSEDKATLRGGRYSDTVAALRLHLLSGVDNLETPGPLRGRVGGLADAYPGYGLRLVRNVEEPGPPDEK